MIEVIQEGINDVLAKGREDYKNSSADELYSMIENPAEFDKKLAIFKQYVPDAARVIPFPLPRELATPIRNSGNMPEITYMCDMDENGLVWLAATSKDSKDFVTKFLDSDFNAGVDNPSFFGTIVDTIMSV